VITPSSSLSTRLSQFDNRGIVRYLPDTLEALFVLDQDEAARLTLVPDQAIPAQLVDRAGLFTQRFAEQGVQLLSRVDLTSPGIESFSR
jgi:hypothetical protein